MFSDNNDFEHVLRILMPSATSVDEGHDPSEQFSSVADQREDEIVAGRDDVLTTGQAWCLYLSHFLSMWNSRTYEYGAVRFTVVV